MPFAASLNTDRLRYNLHPELVSEAKTKFEKKQLESPANSKQM
jgi:hypothetical protein